MVRGLFCTVGGCWYCELEVRETRRVAYAVRHPISPIYHSTKYQLSPIIDKEEKIISVLSDMILAG